MVEISTPLSIWMQLASFFFTLSGIHADLLIIRFFLFVAYLFLFCNAVLGSPLWPDATNTGFLPLDSLCWSILGLYVHGASLANLLLDERAVQFKSDDEAALWRMFYRTGGLSARIYKSIVSPYLEIVTFQPGDIIPTDDFFYILYKGSVHLRVYKDGKLKTERISMHSGDMFDMKYLWLFRSDHFFMDHQISCASISKSTLFRFSRSDMKKIAQQPLVKSVWQSLIINNLSTILEKYVERQAYFSNELDDEDTDRIFRPLEKWEIPKASVAGSGRALRHPWRHFWDSTLRKMALPWPFGIHLNGIRQTQLSPPVNPPSSNPERVCTMHGSCRNLCKTETATSMSVLREETPSGHAESPDMEKGSQTA